MIVLCGFGLCGLAKPAAAQVRRAVVIGINNYAVDPPTDRTKNLDGAVNDAQAMAETLRTYHGFKPDDIHLITDQEATRGRILKEVEEHLIAKAQPGDISLFYFAGHGSYQDNARSREVDHRDETIVPADANRGTADIRDKELARLFNRVLDRKAGLVAIFDSCHSGSISRGIGDEGKYRFAAPRSGPPVKGEGAADAVAIPPEDRGALILAATQDQQPAQERFIKGQPRGRFTSALQQILNTSAPGEPVDSMFLRLRALMQAGGSVQEPALASTKERRQKTLWGTAASERAARPRVAVGSVADGSIVLQAGYAIGLGAQATLRAAAGSAPVQLQVTEVLGPTTSRAMVRGGSAAGVKAGDLFEVETFGAPYLEPLRVFLGVTPPRRQEVDALVKALAPLRAAGDVTWIADPTEVTPTHTLLWSGGKWLVRDAQRRDAELAAPPTLKEVRHLVHAGEGAAVRLFFSVPLPAESLAALSLGKGSGSKSVELTTDPRRADYVLVGRAQGPKPEFAWVLPGADKAARPGVPLRSEWLGVSDSGFAAGLSDAALRLARLKTWQTLETPPGGSRFPYRLQLQNLATKQFLPPGTPVRNGETYRPVLLASGSVSNVQPRYVYLFALDSNGGSSLLVPGPGMLAGENLVPDSRDHAAAAPSVIPLGLGFAVSPPYGTDTLVMLASATALPDPSVLIIKPLHRGLGAASPCTDPMECLIFGINEENTRGSQSAPTDWSIDRLIVHSVEK